MSARSTVRPCPCGPARVAAAVIAGTLLCRAQFPQTLWVPVTYYDYHADGSNPNFEPAMYDETYSGLRTGMVRETLSADRKPLLRMNRVFNDRVEEWFRPSGIGGTPAAFTIDPFDGRGTWSYLQNYLGRPDEWRGANWNSTAPMVNVVIYDSLPFVLEDIRKGMFRYDSPYFVPIDRRGFGAEPAYYPRYDWRNTLGNNFSFAMELHRDFMYRSGLEFDFTGDDDVWAFINGRLVMDLGGIHGPLNRTVRLDTMALTIGQIYHFDFFFAERHVNHSQLTLSANFLLSPYTVIGLVPHESPTWDVTPLLQWHPGEFSVTYTLQVSTSPAFSTLMYSATTRDTFCVTLPLQPGPCYWRVRAENAPWSSPGAFVLLDPRVPIPVPYAPDPTTERQPVLRWLTPPAPSAAYRLLVSASPDFSDALLDTVTADTAALVHPALPYGPVYWCVRSESYPVWSLPDTFTVVPDTVPRLIAYNGDTLQEHCPLLAWHPVPGAGAYQVELANNPMFHRATVVHSADTSWAPDSLRPGMVWYWRVSSNRDYRLYSDIDSFVVAWPETGVRAPAALRPRFPPGAGGNVLRAQAGAYVSVLVHDLSGRFLGRLESAQRRETMTPGGGRVVVVTVRDGSAVLLRQPFVLP